jgi:hypothetical protein
MVLLADTCRKEHISLSHISLSYILSSLVGSMFQFPIKKHVTNSLQPMMLGIFGLLGFIVYSVYWSSEPLIRRSLFNSPTAITAYAGTFIHGVIVWSLLYYMPLFFEVAKDYSPVTSGIAVFPLTFTVAPAAIVVGLVIAKTGRYRPSIVSLLSSLLRSHSH